MKQGWKLHNTNVAAEPEPVKWWLAEPKRAVGRPRKDAAAPTPAPEPVVAAVNINPAAFDPPEIKLSLPDLSAMTMDWSEERPDLLECKCVLCGFAGVFVTRRVLRKQGLLKCPLGHSLSPIVRPGMAIPKLKLQKVA